MKLTFILLTVVALQVSAKGYTQSITLSEKNAPLEKIFESITRQSGYRFFYNEEQLQRSRPVTIQVKETSLEETLDLALKDQPFTYAIINKVIVIKEKINGLAIQTPLESVPLVIDVKGRVLNEKGEPAEGVTVTIKGTNIATSTDANGEFSLGSVDPEAVLVFTSVNMETFEYKVKGKTELAISLKAKITALADVIVTVNTGYEQVTKERFVGSFSQLDSQNFHRRVGMNIIDRLDGTVTGVLFNKKGSGIESPIQIRGISTLGTEGTPTHPLIVVDNFPMPLEFDINNINPNDVESVTVLKDAAAASIWGSRAGNGVIVITTKKGKYNQRFHLDVSSNITVEEKPDLFYYKRISTSDFIDIENFLFDNSFYDQYLSNTFTYPVVSTIVEILDAKRAGLISDADAATQINALRNNDLRNELNKYVYREALRQQHYIGFNGGTNTLAYQFSFGYNRSLNNIRGSKGDNRYTISTNTNFRPVKNLEIQTGIELALTNNKSYDYQIPNSFSPYDRLADNNGNALANPYYYRAGYVDTAGGGQLLDWRYRPLDEIKYADINSVSKFARLYVGINYQFTNWLSANVKYQYQINNADFRNYKSLQIWETRDLVNQFTDLSQPDPNLMYPVPKGGILDLANDQYKSYNVRGSLNLNKNFGGLHQITGLIGGEVSDSKGGYSSSQRLYGYDDLTGSYRASMDYFNFYPRIYAADPGSVAFIPNNSRYRESSINRFVSMLANASYLYKNRYTIYASARKDGSNVFGVNTNNRWKPLWSVGGGWEISKESFYKISWLPYLKIRSSFGYTGNSNNSLSGKLIFMYSSIGDAITNLPYTSPVRAPNPDLKWEEVRIINSGIDFQLFKNRLSGSFELFSKRSADVIADAPMPPSSGVNFFTLNYANMKTNGYELVLNSKNIKGPIEWTTNFGWSHAKTVVTKIYTTTGSRATDFLDYQLKAVEGRVAYGIASYRWAGLDPMTGDPRGYYDKQVTTDYTIIFNDSVQNQVFHGSSLPLSSGFIRNNVSWKGFTLSVNITGRFNYYFREPALTIDYMAEMNSTTTSYGVDYYKRWQKPGDEAITNVPSMLYPISPGVEQRNQFYKFAEIHVKRADNIRLQDIRLSWQWNNNNNRRLPFQSVQLFFYTNNLNLILWRADKSAYDPDFSGGNGDGIAGPIPKTWTTGMTISF